MGMTRGPACLLACCLFGCSLPSRTTFPNLTHQANAQRADGSCSQRTVVLMMPRLRRQSQTTRARLLSWKPQSRDRKLPWA
ncbi:hypothetical protein LZ30DRAFT_703713 [Colletotrichum cereale]|nr:hypothetical protein LZ30DRAFT_703713 [Colletotrichum cereale]